MEERELRLEALAIAVKQTKEVGGVMVQLNTEEILDAAKKYIGFIIGVKNV